MIGWLLTYSSSFALMVGLTIRDLSRAHNTCGSLAVLSAQDAFASGSVLA